MLQAAFGPSCMNWASVLCGIRDSRKAGRLWAMMRGVGEVRKSIHQSWLCCILIIITTQQLNRRVKPSFIKICTSHFIVGFEKVVQGFMVRGSWRPNRTGIYWPPLLWPSALCLSRSPGLLNRRPRSPLCWVRAFFTTSYQQLLWTPTHRVPSAWPGLAWPGFPYHILSATYLQV